MKKFKRCLLFLVLFCSIFFPINSFAEENPLEVISDKDVCETDKDKYFWVIYDNVCPYCKESKEHIKALDWQGQFKFLSFRDPLTYKMFPNLKKEECEKDVHMVTPKGEVVVGYEVFRTVIDNLAATKLLNPLFKNNFAEKKLQEIYEKKVKERSCYYNMNDTCPLKKKI